MSRGSARTNQFYIASSHFEICSKCATLIS